MSAQEWDALSTVGVSQVEPIVFARGGARLTERSQQSLAELAEMLQAFPQYYVIARGHARPEGDMEANHKLAEDRAAAAVRYLVEAGVPEARLKAMSGALAPQGGAAATGGEAQTVSFQLGQLPY